MKELLIIAVGLFIFSGVAVAQNNSETVQAGDRNEAIITQIDNNTAFVFQGDGFAFYPGASELGASTNNSAEVNQTGSNLAYIGQGINEGSAVNSEAIISQTGSSYADIFQGVLRDAENAFADITQNGSGNQGFVRQSQVGFVLDVDATIVQDGDNNYASILQGFGGGSTSEDNIAEISQVGSDNTSTTILQGSNVGSAGPGSGAGTATDNSATISITGNSNGVIEGVRINQGINGGTATDNTGYILQDGNSNDSIINQGVGNGEMSVGSIANIFQYSDSNMSFINQNGENNTANIIQN